MNEMAIKEQDRIKIKEAEQLSEAYYTYQIVDNEKYQTAANDLKLIKTKTSELEELRKSLTKPLDESKKRIMDLFRIPLERLVQAENIVKRAMLFWHQKQEQIRQEKEQKLQEMARKEEERLRKIKDEQEKAWREKEEAKREEASRLEAQGKAKEAEKARIEAEKAGAKAAERAEQAQEISIPAPTLEPKIEKIEGISTKKIWKFRIINVNLIPRDYLIPNEKILGEIARTTSGTLKISGIEFYSEEIITSRKG
jgi:hypothetical protein